MFLMQFSHKKSNIFLLKSFKLKSIPYNISPTLFILSDCELEVSSVLITLVYR